MKIYKVISIFLLVFFVSCSQKENHKPLLMASSYPIYVILNELTKDIADIDYIVPTGASPHTYTPKPSDVKKSVNSLALFYVAQNLDGWITEIPSKNKIKMIDLVSKDDIIYFACNHNHHNSEADEHQHDIDPHFWFDPILVKNILPELSEIIIKLYPEGKDEIIKNKENFEKKLDSINIELVEILKPVKDKKVFLHHPSFNYMLERYGLIYGGSIEESPGKEPSPKFLAELINKIKESAVKSIFTEPQLNYKNAKIIAEESGVKLSELNPEGSPSNTKTYKDLLIYNANILRKGLE